MSQVLSISGAGVVIGGIALLSIYKHKTRIYVEQEIPRLDVHVVGMGNEVGMRNGCGHMITPLSLARQWYSLTGFVILLDVTSKGSIWEEWI
jgi:hypothetical protein